MCDPVSAAVVIGGLVTSAVAQRNQTKQGNRNAQAVQTAKEAAYRQGIARQDTAAAEAREGFNTSLNQQGADAFGDTLADAAGQRLGAFNEASTTPGDYSRDVPKNVRLAQEQAFGESSDKTSSRNQALAALTGYGDASFNQGLARNKYARAFGNLSDKAQRDRGLIQLQMQNAANNAFKGPSASLGAAKQIGQLAASYGAAGTPGINTTGATVARPNQAFVGPQPLQPHFGGYGPF